MGCSECCDDVQGMLGCLSPGFLCPNTIKADVGKHAACMYLRHGKPGPNTLQPVRCWRSLLSWAALLAMSMMLCGLSCTLAMSSACA